MAPKRLFDRGGLGGCLVVAFGNVGTLRKCLKNNSEKQNASLIERLGEVIIGGRTATRPYHGASNPGS